MEGPLAGSCFFLRAAVLSSCSLAAWFLQHPRQSVAKGPLWQLGISTSHHRHSCGGPRPSILGPGRVGLPVASVTSARWKGAVQATERPVRASLPPYTNVRNHCLKGEVYILGAGDSNTDAWFRGRYIYILYNICVYVLLHTYFQAYVCSKIKI